MDCSSLAIRVSLVILLSVTLVSEVESHKLSDDLENNLVYIMQRLDDGQTNVVNNALQLMKLVEKVDAIQAALEKCCNIKGK